MTSTKRPRYDVEEAGQERRFSALMVKVRLQTLWNIFDFDPCAAGVFEFNLYPYVYSIA
jgi:hypothetical protein